MAFLGVSPYLYYADGAAALDWMESVFGFGPSKRDLNDDGTVSEAEIVVGSGKVHICGRAPDDGHRELLIVSVDDVDALYERVSQSLEDPVDPPKDTGYGPRALVVDDPWGYHWYFWQGDAQYT